MRQPFFDLAQTSGQNSIVHSAVENLAAGSHRRLVTTPDGFFRKAPDPSLRSKRLFGPFMLYDMEEFNLTAKTSQLWVLASVQFIDNGASA